MDRSLLCFAKGRFGDWEAICLDLDIAVQGDSFEDVYASLNEAIELYVETVVELTEADQARLLDRPAPLGLRLRFLRFAIRALFHVKGRDSSSRIEFSVPLAA